MIEYRAYLSKKETMKKVDESNKKALPLQEIIRIQLELKENRFTPSPKKRVGS